MKKKNNHGNDEAVGQQSISSCHSTNDSHCGDETNNEQQALLIPNDQGHTAKDSRCCCCSAQRWRPALFIMFLAFAFGLANSSIAPVLPGVKRRYFGSDQAAASAQTAFQATSAFLALTVAPVLGSLMDTVGRRPFFLFLAFWNIIPFAALLIFRENPLPHMISKYMAIVSHACYYAYLADHYDSLSRATAYGMYIAAQQLSALGGLLGLFLSDGTLLIFAMSCHAIGSLLVLFFLHESLPTAPPHSINDSNSTGRNDSTDSDPSVCHRGLLENPFRAMKGVITSKGMVATVFLMAVFNMSELGVDEVYMYYLNQRVGFHKGDNAFVYAEMGVLNPLVMLCLIPFLTRVVRLRQVTLLFIATVALATQMIMMCIVFQKWQIFALGLPATALVNINLPAIAGLVANGGPEEEQGRRQTGFKAISDLFKVLGPLLFGQTYAVLHGDWVLLPYVLAGAMAIPAFFVVLKVRRWVLSGDGIVDELKATESTD